MGFTNTVVTAGVVALTVELIHNRAWYLHPDRPWMKVDAYCVRDTVAAVMQRSLNWYESRVTTPWFVDFDTRVTLHEVVYDICEEAEEDDAPLDDEQGTGVPVTPPPSPASPEPLVSELVMEGESDVVCEGTPPSPPPPPSHSDAGGNRPSFPDPVGRKTRFRAWAVRQLRLSYPDLWMVDSPEHRCIIRKAICVLFEEKRVRQSHRLMHLECIRALYFLVTPDYIEAQAISASEARHENAKLATSVGAYVQREGFWNGVLRALFGRSPLSADWVTPLPELRK